MQKRLLPLLVLFIILLINNIPFISSSANYNNDENKIIISLNIDEEYFINSTNDVTHINISGNLYYSSYDPRVCKIELIPEIENWPTLIQPTMMYAVLRGNFSFNITIKVPKLTEDCSRELNVSGQYSYEPGGPFVYLIDPHKEYINLNVIDDNNSEQSEITIKMNTEPEYSIDPEENSTIINITGNVEYVSNDPRICKIELKAEIDNGNTYISPSMIYAQLSGNHPFTISVAVPQMTEDCQENLVVSGRYSFEPGGPVAYIIDPVTELLNFKILDNNTGPEDTGSSTNSDSPGLGIYIVVCVIIIVLIVYLISRRR